jgi:hypothetical protein
MAREEITLPPEVLALAQDEPKPEVTTDMADELLKLLPPEDWEGSSEAKAEPPSTGYPWTSAAHARTWLNSLSDPKAGTGLLDFLRVHRGDVSLVAAILLVLVAVFWSRTDRSPSPANSTVTTSANSTVETLKNEEAEPDPVAQLSFWDRALIALGLAEAPPAQAQPLPIGNPEISVWVDLHTALYYCPGTELYGKTENGRFTTQHDAQHDHFGPASGRVCE